MLPDQLARVFFIGEYEGVRKPRRRRLRVFCDAQFGLISVLYLMLLYHRTCGLEPLMMSSRCRKGKVCRSFYKRELFIERVAEFSRLVYKSPSFIEQTTEFSGKVYITGRFIERIAEFSSSFSKTSRSAEQVIDFPRKKTRPRRSGPIFTSGKAVGSPPAHSPSLAHIQTHAIVDKLYHVIQRLLVCKVRLDLLVHDDLDGRVEGRDIITA